MRKIILLALIGLLGIIIPNTSVLAAKKNVYLEEEKTKKQYGSITQDFVCGRTGRAIRVGGFVTNPPFGWVNVTQTSDRVFYSNDGFSYNLFIKLADKLNLKTKNVGFSSFADAVLALRKGQIDVLAGAYYDKHVLGVGTTLMFPGYFKNPIIVVFPKGKERPVKSYTDLKDLRGVIRQEEILYSLIYQQMKGFNIEQISGARNAYTKLIKGEADYLITSLYTAEAEARRFKLIDDLVFTDYALIQPELFFVFSTNSPCTKNLKPLFSNALKEELADSKAYFSYFMTYLDGWGERFRNDPPLIQQLQEETTATPVELVESNAPTEIDDTPIQPIDLSNGTPVPSPAE